jgi:Ribbon-helix-helix protein, copG family
LRLEPELLRELREFAEHRGISVSDALRQAAAELLDRSTRSPFIVSVTHMQPQQYIRETLAQSNPTSTGSIAEHSSTRVA